MSKRLVKVAKELNVGTKTIVEFLNNNGFSLKNRPTAKVSEEMYDALVKNFQKSIAVKEQANQITIGTRKPKDEKESPKEENKSWDRSKSQENSSNEEPQQEAKKEQKPVEHISHRVTGPKILGKIDLDGKKKNQPEIKKEPEVKVEPKPKKEVQKKEEEPVVEQKAEVTPPKVEKKVEKPEKKEKEPVLESPTPAKEVKAKTKTKKSKKAEQKTPEKEPVKDKAPKAEKEEKESQEDETAKNPKEVTVGSVTEDTIVEDEKHETKVPQLKGLKILGKINIESRKKKRTKKSTKQGGKDNKQDSSGDKATSQNKDRQNQNREQRNRSRNQNDNRGNNQNRNQNDNRGNNQDRNQNENRGNNQNRNQNDNRGNNQNRNDNRGNNQDRNQNKPQGQNSDKGGTGAGGDKKKRRKKIKITKGNNTGSNSGNNNSNDREKKQSGKGKRRKEISQKEVQEKIKATLARVQGSGQKRRKFGSTRSARDERKEKKQRQEEDTVEEKALQVVEFVSVSELANLLGVGATDVIMACMKEDIFVSINQRLDSDVIELIALEFGREVEFITAEDQIEAEVVEEEDLPEDLKPRSPIVTVMGHVDHGKTSLLDRIRKADVATGEAGGITQHVGAYEVEVAGSGKITFLDTPGHEAFTAMRARGAKVTDIAVIIIAADDNVMPQTKEAISHAQAAEVPIIFAINKIDKEGANPDRIKQELASMDLLIEEWGGKYQSQEISAKQGLNIDLLLEKILLEAEMLELKANPDKNAVGTVVEASLEKGRGYVTKILVQAGTMSIGDPIVAGHFSGKVRAMFNERGKRVKTAGPSTPVLVLGLQGAPQAGEKLKVMPSEREAKELATKRAQIVRQQQIRATRRITLADINRRLKVGNFQELNLIVKGDVDGSIEALSDSLLKLSTEQIQTNIVYKAVGQITESDVNLAAASDAVIIGFQVRPNPMAKRLAEQEGIQIKTYSIIYNAIEEVKLALEGMLEPKEVEEEVGLVEIQQVFKIPKAGFAAGCMVKEGKIFRNSFIRIIRNGIVEYPKKEGAHGELGSLKRFKENVNEVKFGTECGLTIKGYNDFKEGDMIEVYEVKEVKQTLD